MESGKLRVAQTVLGRLIDPVSLDELLEGRKPHHNDHGEAKA
jgi:hypothetical protein